jgi:hypothetical protein
VYNLTAHESINKTGFYYVWDESLCGRSGNDIASGLIKILKKIVKMYPSIKSFKLWSDSCVAQNKNSIMTFALIRGSELNFSFEIEFRPSERNRDCDALSRYPIGYKIINDKNINNEILNIAHSDTE